MKQFIKSLRTRNSRINTQKIVDVVNRCDSWTQEGIIKDVIVGDRILFVMGDYIITRDLLLENILVKNYGKRRMELIMGALVDLDVSLEEKHLISEGLKSGEVTVKWVNGVQFVVNQKKEE